MEFPQDAGQRGRAGAVEAVVEELRARRISCYARRVVDDGEGSS